MEKRKRKSNNNLNIYAIYKGENFLTEGTVKECAEFLKVKPSTIYYLACKTNWKRMEGKRKNGKERNRLLGIIIGNIKEEIDGFRKKD